MRKLITCSVFVLLLLSNISLFAQNKMADALKESLVEIDSNAQMGYTMNLELFKRVSLDNKIIALGEATHGTKDFVDFRLSVIKNLVGELGYKAIVTESDFSSTLAIDNYIVLGKGNLRQCLQEMGYWMWNNPDFMKTVEWLKEYNASKELKDRVHVYGCDMTVPSIIGQLISGTQSLKKPLSGESITGLKLLRTWSTKSIAKYEELALEKLRQDLKAESLLYSDTSTFKNSISTILQVISFRLISSGKGQSAFRDKSMLDNINWIFNHENGGKLIFLAHNLHIAKNPISDGWENVGSLLRKTYGAEYYALGFCFYKGQFRAQDRYSGQSDIFNLEQVDKNFVEYTLNETNVSNFYIDLRLVKENRELDGLLLKKRPIRSVGAIFSNSKHDNIASSTNVVLSEVFDGIIFFEKTNAMSGSYAWEKKYAM